MNSMFYGCSSLNNLDLSSFDTKQVTQIFCMFYGCSSLERLNISSFNISNNINIKNSDIFNGCSSLKLVYCNDRKICEILKNDVKCISDYTYFCTLF